MTRDCAQAEVLAGAVALGEATDAERDTYRRHLAGCRRCVTTLGGERDIERVMSTIARARDEETWEPDLRAALAARAQYRASAWRWGLSGIAAAAVISLGIHALVASQVPPVARVAATVAAPSAPAITYNGMHIALEHRARQSPVHRQVAQVAQAPQPQQRLVVVHNVVNLPRPVTHAVAPERTTTVATAHVKATAEPVAVAMQPTVPTERDRGSIGALRTATSAPAPAARAESLAVMQPPPVVHEVTPIGGETAIVPRPPDIAYMEGAQGTTAFEVNVDERGVPVKCTIVKPSGFLVLDNSVCKAALQARYSPRTVNGKPVPGVYSDAFKFQATNDDQH